MVRLVDVTEEDDEPKRGKPKSALHKELESKLDKLASVDDEIRSVAVEMQRLKEQMSDRVDELDMAVQEVKASTFALEKAREEWDSVSEDKKKEYDTLRHQLSNVKAADLVPDEAEMKALARAAELERMREEAWQAKLARGDSDDDEEQEQGLTESTSSEVEVSPDPALTAPKEPHTAPPSPADAPKRARSVSFNPDLQIFKLVKDRILYSILNASPDDPPERIDQNYRELISSFTAVELTAALEVDCLTTEPTEMKNLTNIMQAYRILSDDELRAVYDQGAFPAVQLRYSKEEIQRQRNREKHQRAAARKKAARNSPTSSPSSSPFTPPTPPTPPGKPPVSLSAFSLGTGSVAASPVKPNSPKLTPKLLPDNSIVREVLMNKREEEKKCEAEYMIDFARRKAVEEIERLEDDKPSFLALNPQPLHDPSDSADQLLEFLDPDRFAIKTSKKSKKGGKRAQSQDVTLLHPQLPTSTSSTSSTSSTENSFPIVQPSIFTAAADSQTVPKFRSPADIINAISNPTTEVVASSPLPPTPIEGVTHQNKTPTTESCSVEARHLHAAPTSTSAAASSPPLGNEVLVRHPIDYTKIFPTPSHPVQNCKEAGVASPLDTDGPNPSFHYLQYLNPITEDVSLAGLPASVKIARGLLINNFSILDNFHPLKQASRLADEIQDLHTQGRMRKGEIGVGASAQGSGTNVGSKGVLRDDEILWLEGDEPFAKRLSDHMLKVDDLIEKVDRFLSGIAVNLGIHGRSKAMASAYMDEGAKYVWHFDNPNQNGRALTVIWYSNRSWKPEDGGICRVSTAGHMIDVAPLFNRLFVFWSDKRCPHQVTPSFKRRHAITVWYFNSFERKLALERQKR